MPIGLFCGFVWRRSLVGPSRWIFIRGHPVVSQLGHCGGVVECPLSKSVVFFLFGFLGVYARVGAFVEFYGGSFGSHHAVVDQFDWVNCGGVLGRVYEPGSLRYQIHELHLFVYFFYGVFGVFDQLVAFFLCLRRGGVVFISAN